MWDVLKIEIKDLTIAYCKNKSKLEAPRSLYSSPGYNNMSIKLDNFGKKINKCRSRHCRPLLQ